MPNDILSRLFLAAVCVTPMVAFAVDMARSRYNPVQYVGWCVARLLTRLLWRAQTVGQFPMVEGGAIIVCNHRSSVDPFFVQTSLYRKAHWMVAKEFVEHPALGWFLKGICECIPANRGGIDTASTKLAIRLASQGELVGMLPEGRINRTEEFLLPARPGAALVALKAGVPIVPCYIEGSPYGGTVISPFLMTAQTRIYFGQPIETSEYAARADEEGLAAEITLRALRAIAELAGRPDFQPQLAGRRWIPTAESPAEESNEEGLAQRH
ncbi:MAG: lysophospholipid acyltransferase family protein [Pirellulaceae bacterium]